jgi:alkaline phosphatase
MLVPATEKALEMLSENENGFFLMIESAQIDWGGHENSARYVIEETLDFDRTVGKALEFAAKDGHTLVIVTSDHETGGMSVIDGNFEQAEVTSRFSTGNHSGVMVPLFAFGPKSHFFQGVYENTDIFEKMRKAYGF